MAKNLKKRIYIYIYMNHIAVLFKLTQHCKPTTIKKKNHRKKGQAVKVCLNDPCDTLTFFLF